MGTGELIMEATARVGIGIAAVALCFGATQATAGGLFSGGEGVPSPKSNASPVGAKIVPDFTASDVDRSAAALGRTATQTSKMVEDLPSELQVPPGSTSMREGLWHYGPRKLGTVRALQYDSPIEVGPRKWRQMRTFEGKGQPDFFTDEFGVDGLKEVSVYVGTDGRVLAVVPTDYEGFTHIKMAKNPPNTKEEGE